MERQDMLITRRGLLKSVGVGLASMVLSSCRKRETSIESNKNDNANNSKKKDEITMYVQKEVYKSVNGHIAKTSEWGPCLWDAEGNHPYYVGYVGIKERNFCLASDGNAPFMLSLGRRGIIPDLKPDPRYHEYPVDVNQIDFLGKKYDVVSIDPNKITLRKIKE